MLIRTNVKLWHASFVQIAATVALFTGHIDGAIWLAVTTIALGIHTAGEVAYKHIENGNGHSA